MNKHKPIPLRDLAFSLPHKTCFEGFATLIHPCDRIAIIGQNGSGKSSLINIIIDIVATTITLGHVPQTIVGKEMDHLSGGERFNKALTAELAKDPNILLLDEPTNHLDTKNRASLMRMLRAYAGTLLVVSHDVELLRSCNINLIWAIENSGHITLFSGCYDDYIKIKIRQHKQIESKLAQLGRAKKQAHLSLMQEQEKAHKKKLHGEKKYRDDKLALRGAQEKGQNTTSKKKGEMNRGRKAVLSELQELQLPEIIKPKFSLSSHSSSSASASTILSIRDGEIGYDDNSSNSDHSASQSVLSQINLFLPRCGRMALCGDNGSGKTTLIRAISGDSSVIIKSGDWHLPKREEMGFLDQHYELLLNSSTVLETITSVVPDWPQTKVRSHLNDFLFRKNEEVNAYISTLSGGEKARLSLAQIAAKTPKLLILDEITNNIDLETRQHLIQIVLAYPGSLIVISHDQDFLEQIAITDYYKL